MIIQSSDVKMNASRTYASRSGYGYQTTKLKIGTGDILAGHFGMNNTGLGNTGFGNAGLENTGLDGSTQSMDSFYGTFTYTLDRRSSESTSEVASTSKTSADSLTASLS